MPVELRELKVVRARSGARIWLAAFLLGASAPLSLAAQQPGAPADSAGPAVTIPIPDDELSPDTIPEAVQAAAEVEVVVTKLPVFPMVGTPGWDSGRWEWTRADLDRLPGITISEFIQRIPGVLRFRGGSFGRPEGLTPFGAGGGRVRVLLDGLELDALGHGTYPLETLAVLDVARIRVDRTLSEIRVDIETFRLPGSEPYSAVELGTGVYQTRLLRALFSRGLGTRIVGTGGIDLANTGGIGVREDYGSANAYLRGSYALDERSGLGLEVRRTAADREGAVFPEESSRSDLVVRYRNQLSEASVIEALVGRTSFDEATPLSQTDSSTVRAALTQGVLRTAYGTERIGVEASARGRLMEDDTPALPTGELEARVSAGPFGPLRLEADGRFATAEEGSASSVNVLGSIRLPGNLSVFGSAALGSRLTQVRTPASVAVPVPARFPTTLIQADASGWRAGAELGGRENVLGVALFQQGAGTLAPFGLGFDVNLPTYEASVARGVEASVDALVPRTSGTVRLQGSFTYMLDAGDRAYLPGEYGRAGLYFTNTFFGGQLEPSLRVEGVHRGAARVPDEERTELEALAPAYQMLNLSLHIRIIDIRLFLDWENVISNTAARDFPYGPPAFPRILYGANWHFSN